MSPNEADVGNGRLVWLASYPKSGNTWMRVLIANLLSPAPVDINGLDEDPLVGARAVLDENLGLCTSDLTHEEVARERPSVYRSLSSKAAVVRRFKVHDAFTLPDGTPLFPPEATRAALYLVRHPFDVAVSYAHHLALPLDQVIDVMSRWSWSVFSDRDSAGPQVRQWIGSWSGNVASWLDAPVRKLIVRYEDLWGDTAAVLLQVAQFLDLPHEDLALKRAVSWSSLRNLQEQETAHGFREKAPQTKQFFRRGMPGEGNQVLTEAQRQRLVRDHGEVMQRLGYS
jgi:hypothetical protein